jgi:membrane-associated phospholipid phosphatase
MSEVADDGVGPARVHDREPATLHADLPMTMRGLQGQAPWILAAVAALFVTFAVLARVDALPWDRPITDWLVDQRTPWRNDLAKAITRFGSDQVVYVVAAICAVVAWPRCRPLAISIVVLAVTRSLIIVTVKEIVARDRPPSALQLVEPGGYSFPSGHPFATAASWGFIPLVIALYTQRRWIWWTSVCVVWTLAVLVGASRVYLGVHFVTDVVAGLLLAVLFVAGSEVLIVFLHRRNPSPLLVCGASRASPRAGGPP